MVAMEAVWKRGAPVSMLSICGGISPSSPWWPEKQEQQVDQKPGSGLHTIAVSLMFSDLISLSSSLVPFIVGSMEGAERKQIIVLVLVVVDIFV